LLQDQETSPMVSVIVPVYNSAEFLEKCVYSVLTQTMDDFELICVNDGSVDGSALMLENFAGQDSRVRVFSQENCGLAATRNAGMVVARGHYLYFLDSDDWLAPNTLERCIEQAQRNRLDVLYFGGVTVFDPPEVEKKFFRVARYYARRGRYADVEPGPMLFRELRRNGEYRASACMQLIRKEYLDDIGVIFPEGLVSEDEAFTLAVLLSSTRAGCILDCLYFRRIREGSLVTGETYERRIEGLVAAIRLAVWYLKCGQLTVSNRLAVGAYVFSSSVAIIRLMILGRGWGSMKIAWRCLVLLVKCISTPAEANIPTFLSGRGRVVP